MNELYRYLTLAVTNEWRRLDEDERAAHKREFANAVERSGARVHPYSLVGARADADLLLWAIADELDELRDLESRLVATRFRSYAARPCAQ